MTTSDLVPRPRHRSRIPACHEAARWVNVLAASLVPLMAAPIAFASSWTQVATFADGTSLLVDTASISSSGRYRRGSFKLVALQPADLPDGAIPNTSVPPGQKFTYVVELFYAKCAKERIALIEGKFYGADDSLLGNIPPTAVSHAEFEEVPQGSVAEAIVRRLCRTP